MRGKKHRRRVKSFGRHAGVLPVALVLTLSSVTVGLAAPAAPDRTDPVPVELESDLTIDARSERAASADFERIAAIAESEGSVRVIVGLQMLWAPEPMLESVAQGQQAATIQARQSGLLDALAGSTHRVTHRYDYVPYIALELGPDGVAALQSSSLAASIQLDEADPVSRMATTWPVPS